MKKNINRNNRCIWDSGGDFFLCGRLSGSDLSGLDILGICGSEKEN